MMWSPGTTLVTPAPISSTMPAASWPSTMGSGGVQSPFMMCQSLWQIPAAFTFTRASPARGPSWVRSTISRGEFALKSTAAFTGFSFPGSPLRLRGDGDHLDLHCGRHGDRAVEGSAVLPDGHQLIGLRLVDAAELELHVDGLEPVRLRIAADALDHRLHALERNAVVGGVLLDERHAARGDAREEGLAIGHRLVGSRRRVQDEVLGAGRVERPAEHAAAGGAHRVDLDVVGHGETSLARRSGLRGR